MTPVSAGNVAAATRPKCACGRLRITRIRMPGGATMLRNGVCQCGRVIIRRPRRALRVIHG